MTQIIRIDGLEFVCDDPIEEYRAKTLLIKEKGTIAWLNAELRSDDVFYDIGANIGLYSLVAARLVQTYGLVVAFEPHVANAHSLMRNIAVNKFYETVRLVTSALHNSDAFLMFNYHSKRSGSSGSQLGHALSEHGQEFYPAFKELKHATTIDRLLEDEVLRVPTVMKLDVDGNELFVLEGAKHLLHPQNTKAPRSIQVELHPLDRTKVIDWMTDHHYVLEDHHHTLFGQRQIEQGTQPETLSYNGLFRRM